MDDRLIDIISKVIYSSQNGDEFDCVSFPKASRQTIYNAYDFVTHCPQMSLLDSVSIHPTNRSAVRLKWVMANGIAFVDIDDNNFSYKVKKHPAEDTKSGTGDILSSSDISVFYESLLESFHSNCICNEK